MKLGQYKPLNKKYIKDTLSNYVSALEIPVIDYVAIGVQDTIRNMSTSVMSRPDWQSTFHDLNLAESDPIRRTSLCTKSNIFSFDEIDYYDTAGREVMRHRKRHYIENGIVVMKRNLGHNFMLTLATGYKNFDSRKFYFKNNAAISTVFGDLVRLISPSTKEFQVKIS